MEGFSWPFPQEAFRPPNASPYAVFRAPAFSFLKRDPHAPASAMQKKRPVLQVKSLDVQKQTLMQLKSSFQSYFGQK
jgi:hypothetical protein